MADEAVLSKTGLELFRELLRVYSVADIEDYYKAGVWRNEQMKADLQLMEAHRREAGAPEPPSLEDVPMPELPKASVTVASAALPASAVQGMKPVTVLSKLVAAALKRPVMPSSASQAAAQSAVTPMAEFQLIEAFIKKWQLDPMKAKMLLANVPHLRRRLVLQTFKTQATGAAALHALVQFVAQCAKAGSAGTAAPAFGQVRPAATPLFGLVRPAAATATVAGAKRPVAVFGLARPAAATATAAGVKRPIALATQANPMLLDVNKRARLLMPAATTGPAKQFAAVAKQFAAMARPVLARPLAQPVRPVRAQMPVRPVRAQIPFATSSTTPNKPNGSLLRSLLQKL